MKKRIGIPLAILGLLLGYLTLANRVFFPWHRVVALSIYGIVAILVIWLIIRKWHSLEESKQTVLKKLLVFLPHIFIGKTLITLAYMAWVLTPIEDSMLMELSDEQLDNQMISDMASIQSIDQDMDVLISAMDSTDFFKEVESVRANSQLWADYLDHMTDLDMLKNKYKTFYQLDYNTRPTRHANAFFVTMTAFLTQYQYTLKVSERCEGMSAASTVLNAGGPGFEKESLFAVKQWATNPDVLLQLSAAATYLQIVAKDVSFPETDIQSAQNNLNKILQSLGSQPDLFIKNPLTYFEKTVSDSWNPIRKTAIEQFKNASQTVSKSFSTQELLILQSDLEKGDIILGRRNWRITHIGLPGFWRQAYLVTEKDTNNMIKVLQVSPDGVEISNLSGIERPDYLAILRPNWTPEDIGKAVNWAMGQEDKTFDAQADFVTDETVTDSELIVKAFNTVHKTAWNAEFVQGNLRFLPNDFAETFSLYEGSKEQMVHSVLYWDLSKQSPSQGKDARELIKKSWQRPKWTLLQNP